MELFERIFTSLRAGRTFRIRLLRIIHKFNPNQPIINQESFETNVDEPQRVNHITVQEIILLDCGHSMKDGEFPVQCSCSPPRTFCSRCAIKMMSHCDVCGSPIFPCCRTYSQVSGGREYCKKHKWSWLIGK